MLAREEGHGGAGSGLDDIYDVLGGPPCRLTRLDCFQNFIYIYRCGH